jgi:hypothetical protein
MGGGRRRRKAASESGRFIAAVLFRVSASITASSRITSMPVESRVRGDSHTGFGCGGGLRQGSATLDWSVLLVGPRRTLVERQGGPFTASAARRREWTLPVLYLRPDDFTLVVPSPEQKAGVDEVSASGAGVLLKALRAMRASTGADAPPAYVANLDQRIAQLEGTR